MRKRKPEIVVAEAAATAGLDLARAAGLLLALLWLWAVGLRRLW